MSNNSNHLKKYVLLKNFKIYSHIICTQCCSCQDEVFSHGGQSKSETVLQRRRGRGHWSLCEKINQNEWKEIEFYLNEIISVLSDREDANSKYEGVPKEMICVYI